MESRQALRSIAQQLRCVAQDVEAVAVEGFRSISGVSATTTTPKPKRHHWDELRDTASLLRRLVAMDANDQWLKVQSSQRLDEIADVLEDMYEQNRDH